MSLNINSLASLAPAERQQLLRELGPKRLLTLKHHWPFWAREDQLEPPGDWNFWLILAGRGWGKTRCGAETVNGWANSGRYGRIALVAEDAKDAKDVMIEGDSGILACSAPDKRPSWMPSKKKLEWPNGAVAYVYASSDPEELRGPQFDAAWMDELAKWKAAKATFDMLQFGMRLGPHPRQVITTTPRNTPVLKDLINRPDVHVTKGRTYDNIANLADVFVQTIVRQYEGTRLGRQELEADLLSDTPGSLWSISQLDTFRVARHPALERTVVAVDPAAKDATKKKDAATDETGGTHGIVVSARGIDKHGYILQDGSIQGSPKEWAQRAVDLYMQYEADAIVVETNQGGEMVISTIRSISPFIPIIEVKASKAKWARAEPISSIYEKGLVHHVGTFPDLEDQMSMMTNTGFDGAGSPDRVDALVWGMTHLFQDIILPMPNKDAPLPTKVDDYGDLDEYEDAGSDYGSVNWKVV